MAISDVNTPATFTPVYNDMWHVIDSTNNTQPNFQYIFKIYVEGSYIGKQFKVKPDPTEGYGRLNVSRIISTYVNYSNEINEPDTGVRRELESWTKYYVKYGEEYGALSSGVTQYLDLTTSSTVYAYAGSLPTLDFDNYGYNNYLLASSSKLFLTNMPRTFRIYEDQDIWMPCMVSTTNNFNRYEVKTYNSAGTLIDTFEINNPYNSAGTDDTNKFLAIRAGFNLNTIDGGEFLVGSQPVITDSVYSYTIRTLDNGIPGNPTSETVTFKIQREHCDYDNGYDVIFQNVFGFMDTYRFTRYNSRSISVNRKEYKQSKGEIQASGWVNTNQYRARTQYYTEYQDKLLLRSDWLNTEEAEWLSELISSPMVFIRVDVGGVMTPIPMMVMNSEWEQKSTAQGEVFKLDLQLEYSVKNYRQRG
jgi:hypothetical protein